MENKEAFVFLWNLYFFKNTRCIKRKIEDRSLLLLKCPGSLIYRRTIKSQNFRYSDIQITCFYFWNLTSTYWQPIKQRLIKLIQSVLYCRWILFLNHNMRGESILVYIWFIGIFCFVLLFDTCTCHEEHFVGYLSFTTHLSRFYHLIS